ncbi:MAG: tetratricopeptide repeat protein [Candidatus Omnitrophica bacterium]|nr:tetratricopeptide repeat protein [Candidatus Omnitrophota bacterium]
MMKKVVTICALIFAAAGTQLAFAQSQAAAYNFGDYKSSTLAGKAWQALSEKNLDSVVVYSNKCIELYADKAKEMQANLKEPVTGDQQKIFSLWALNDVATVLYIQGEAYRQAGKNDKAKEAFSKILSDYSFGQTWDPAQKIFWKPADAAKDRLDMISKGLNLDYGDMSSASIVKGAWGALAAKDIEAVKAYVAKVTELYGAKAKEMQAGMKEFAWESKEKIFSFWALNDVGTAYFILGEAYRQAGKNADATVAFQKVVNEFGYSQCWDPQGWFWKPAEAAQQKLIELEAASTPAAIPAPAPDKK